MDSKNEVYDLITNETKYVVLDIEMTPDESEREKRIIQWAVVGLDKGKISYRKSSFIQPDCPIDARITKLTSITNETVAHAPRFQDTYLQLKELLEGCVVVGQNIQFDLQMISKEIQRIHKKDIQIAGWIDTVEWSRVLYPTLLSYKLVDLVEYFQIQLDHAHLADADAEATAKLFCYLNGEWEKLSLGVKKRLIPILKTLHSDYSSLTHAVEQEMDLSEADWEIFEKGCISHMGHCEQTFYAERIRPSEIHRQMQTIGKMQQIFPAYEVREEQLVFFREMVRAWRGKYSKAFEVQPGMGKTFAYLLAGLSQLDEKNRQLLVTTATKHLQKQILQEQIPLVRQFFQKNISAYVLKGAQNYLCVKKFMNQLATHDEIYDVRLAKAQILTWLQKTEIGDMDELNLTPNGEKFFALCSCSQQCLEAKTENNEVCFYAQHIQNAVKSDVLIMNHALFVQNLAKESAPLLRGCKIIVDEAHDLEKVIYQCGTREVDFQNVFFHFSQIGVSTQAKLLKAYMQILKQYGEYQPKRDTKLYQKLEEMKRVFTVFQHETDSYALCRNDWLTTLTESIKVIHLYLKRVEDFQQSLQDMMTERDQKVLYSFAYHMTQIEQYGLFLQNYLQKNPTASEDIQNLTPPYTLAMTDYELIRKILSRLQKYHKEMIFCSGTLMVYGKSNFFLEGLDLTDQLEVEGIGTARSSENLMVYLPESQSKQPITKEEIAYDVQSTTQFLIQKGHKKILVLCNSKEMVEDLYGQLESLSETEDFELLVQGRTSRSREKLYELFKGIEQGILLGTHSFYEGVDFPEETCTAVILPTLPFLSPEHAYVQARQSRGDWIEPLVFMKVLLPNALLLFRQALGRLKRGNQIEKDFVLLDRRICTRTYKKLFLQTIEMEKKTVIDFPLYAQKKHPKRCDHRAKNNLQTIQ